MFGKTSRLFLLVLISGLLTFQETIAQLNRLNGIDINAVNIDDLSDAQIDRISDRIKLEGLSASDMENLAIAQGVNPAQIQKLLARLKERRLTISNSNKNPGSPSIKIEPKKLSSREVSFEPKRGSKSSVYGMSIFNSENLTFQPSTNIPVPDNYVLGIGDEVIVNIWGASKQFFQQTISKQGAILLGNLGPIYLSGMSVKKAQAHVKNRLSAMYKGLSGNNPNTYFQMTFGRLHNISVVVLGEVVTPGTYTISPLSTAFNALYLSGGPAKNGSLRNIEILREGKIIGTIDVYDFLLGEEQQQNIRLRDQDMIRVNTYDTRAQIKGAVKRPMIYELDEGETVSDLINFASGFTGNAYTQNIKLRRKTKRQLELNVLDESEYSTFAIENGDEVEVEVILNKYANRVQIKGAVYRPGDYELERDLTVSKLIERAEGVRAYAYRQKVLLFRTMEDYSVEVFSFDLDELYSGSQEDLLLVKDDILEIKAKPEMKEKMTVRISGEVISPGTYSYVKNMTLSDLIVMANGLRESALISNVEIGRRIRTSDHENDRVSEVFKVSVNAKFEYENSEEPFVIEPFDQVYVRRNPDYENQTTVRISGEVQFPGVYVIKSSQEYLSDIVQRAGGVTEFADLDGTKHKRRSLSDSIFVSIDMKEILNNPHSNKDLVVKPGDIVRIPSKLQIVSVEGAVFNAIAVKYDDRLKFKDYVDYSGGFSTMAKRSKSYVTHANGVSERVKRKLLFFKSYPKIKPGSKIIVPEKPKSNRSVTSQEVFAFTTGLATIALLVQRLLE